MKNHELLETLADIEGVSVNKMLATATYDGICPGICTECHETMEVEPDCAGGWCDACKRNTIMSALMLAGII